jgi:DNA-binding response OmpR family regulator
MMKKILIIDEDTDWLSALKPFFERSGYHPSLANSYPEGFAILDRVQPDLIFLDIQPGNLNGQLLYKKIKGQDKYAHIPIVVTSHTPDTMKISNTDAFLKKPFQLLGLMRTLRHYL